jgi:hypothetical protein
MLTALTTVAVHWLSELWASTFEQQLQLRHDPICMGRLWIVLIHCLLVVISMAAVAALKWRERPTLLGLVYLPSFYLPCSNGSEHR